MFALRANHRALARDGSFQPEQPAYEFGDLCLSIMRDLREVLRAGNIVAIKGLVCAGASVKPIG